MKTLKEALQDWTDWDVAEHALGTSLGCWPEGWESFRDNKGTMWSNNPLGELLATMLIDMATMGLLERRDEPDQQYRWPT